jgi:hypothetical protein
MKLGMKWIGLPALIIIIALIMLNRPKPAEAACTGCGDGGHGTCIEAPGHTHDDEQDHAHEDGRWLDHKHEKK